MELKPLHECLFEKVFSFEVENRKWFEEWVPPRPGDFFVYERFEAYCSHLIQEMRSGEGMYFVGIDNDEVIGRFNLTYTEPETVDIGYRVAYRHVGRGYAHRFVGMLIEEAQNVGVTRVIADALLENPASTSVLKKLGFEATSSKTIPVTLGYKEYRLASYELLLNS